MPETVAGYESRRVYMTRPRFRVSPQEKTGFKERDSVLDEISSISFGPEREIGLIYVPHKPLPLPKITKRFRVTC